MLRKDKVKEVRYSLTGEQGSNVSAAFGIGSFFYKPQDVEFTPEDRTIDFIIVVRDIDKFYSKHDVGEFSRERLRELNQDYPMYLHHDRHRLTVVPSSRFIEWTSPGSPIGYFLRGRLQKPLEKLIEDPFLEPQFNAIREEAVEHAFNRTYEPVTQEQLLLKIARNSYIPEGIRGKVESRWKRKHEKIFAALEKQFHEIYDGIIEGYIRRHDIKRQGDIILPHVTKHEAEAFTKEMEDLEPYYARILLALKQSHPNPRDFTIKKAMRSMGLKNMFWYHVLNLFYPTLYKRLKTTAEKEPSIL